MDVRCVDLPSIEIGLKAMGWFEEEVQNYAARDSATTARRGSPRGLSSADPRRRTVRAPKRWRFREHQPPALAAVSSGRAPRSRGARRRVVAGCREPWARRRRSRPPILTVAGSGMYPTRRGAKHVFALITEARAPARAFVFWRVCG